MTMTTVCKKALLALTALLLAVSMSLAATASAFADNKYVFDAKGVLSDSEVATLESQAAEISNKAGVGVYLVYVSNIGSSTVRDYAKSIYTSQNFGLGSDTSGIMFLVAVDSRDYVTITHGKGINAFTDDYISTMESDIKSQLSNDKWYAAGTTYMADADKALSYYAEKGKPYEEPISPFIKYGVALIIAIIVSVAVVSGKKRAMKTAQIGTEADDYLDESSLVLEQCDDQYRGTIVVCIQTAEDKRRESRSSVDSSGFGGSSGGKF